MKCIIRRSCQDDLENIYELHKQCFAQTDQWYKTHISHFLDSGILIEINNTIIGVLLQGAITPCNQKSSDTLHESLHETLHEPLHKQGYQEDKFEPINSNGQIYLEEKICYKELYGIVMICIDPKYRGKKLAQRLITKHFQDNSNKTVCLNTRRSNINAYRLYQKMGYEHIAFVKNKYFQPTEDSIFMIKDLKNVVTN